MLSSQDKLHGFSLEASPSARACATLPAVRWQPIRAEADDPVAGDGLLLAAIEAASFAVICRAALATL